MWLSIILYAIIIAFFIAIQMHPEMLDAIGGWLARLWPSLFGPTAGQVH